MKQLFFTLIGIGVLFSCSTNENQNTFQFSAAEIIDEPVCELKENIGLIGEVNSFDLLGEDNFVITTTSPERVILYNMDGKQVKTIGKKGEGPFEYLSPEFVRTYKYKIYVFCSTLLKLMVFSKDGTPLREYGNFSKSIKDFSVYEDHLYLYTSGEINTSVIQLYDMIRGEFLAQGFGTKSNEHKVLVSYNCSGGMAVKENKLYFTSVDALTIHQLDMEDLTYTHHEVRDKNFKIGKVNEDHHAFMQDFERSIKYVYDSDIVTGLYPVSDGMVITTEGGEVEMDGLRPVDFYVNRYKRYYYLNDDFEIKKRVVEKLRDDQSNCLITSNGSDIYFLKLEDGESNYHYVLSKMQINQ